MTALRFFFKSPCEGATSPKYRVRPRAAAVAGGVESDEVARLLAAAAGVKYQAALSIAYGAGLRASEVTPLEVGD